MKARILFLLGSLLLATQALTAATLPSGFTESIVASGIASPTAMAFAPDGRLFVCQQGGSLRVIKNNILLATPFLNVTTDSSGERGLLGVTFDPNFANNQWVYIYYTVPGSPPHNRVSRFTASGDVALSGSGTIILELDGLGAGNHNGGALHFGLDAKLYVAVGENATPANSQMLDNLLGKMLRLNNDGSIPTDNPFYNTASGINRAIWALGLRNPFTFAVQPGTGRLFINDVGQNTWEEINVGLAGANYGWPNCEGVCNPPDAGFVDPIHQYSHADGCAITGGAFYNPSVGQFPPEYEGVYFFADYCGGWIYVLDWENSNQVYDFATGLANPVDLRISSDGSLYYLDSGRSSVYRVRYTNAPSITQHPQPQTAPVGGSAIFTVAASGTAPLSYQWQRNGANIANANGTSYTISGVQASDDGAMFACRVSNAYGSTTSNPARLTVNNNSPPTATITAPGNGVRYNAGNTITFSGTGVDPEQGALPPSAFSWTVVFHHDMHTHPFLGPINGVTSGSFVIPTQGETATNVWYRINLTVTDSGGLTQTSFVDVRPRTVVLSLATSPTALQVTLDGQPVTTPAAVASVVGMERTLGAVSPQTSGGTAYGFVSWSDGGAATHTINAPPTATTYTATFQASSSVTIWSSSAVPAVVDLGADSPVALGMKFRSDVAGTITGVRFYKASANTGLHVGKLWSSGGTQLATVNFTGETASGWQQMNFSSPVAIAANTVYVVSYHCPGGHWSFSASYFESSGADNAPLHAPASGMVSGNGVYAYGPAGTFPTATYKDHNYWVDVVFQSGSQAVPPVLAISTVSLPDGMVNAGYTATLAASGGTAPYTWSLAGGTLPSGLTLNGSSGTISGTPTAAGTVNFTMQVSDGGAQTATKALSLTVAGSAPVTIWSSSAVPAVVDLGADSPVALGMKFRSDVAGTITGVRFYKASANTGLHVGKLWSSGGTQLATVNFTGETASGWQQMNFSSPVAIAANTVYVVSYHCPGGHWSFSASYFESSGADNAPLHAPASGMVSGNGVYAYGPAGTFPTATYKDHNYWVDVVFQSGSQAVPPVLAISTVSLPDGMVNAGYTATLAASGGTAPYTWSLAGGTLPSGLTLNGSSGTISGTPTAAGTVNFTMQVSDGGAQTATKALSLTVAGSAPVTIWSSSAVPAVVDLGADSPVALGMKFRSDVAGTITGVRFYKASANTGLHVGKLWSSGGTQLATVNFTGETASGWQQMNFSSPVAIAANTVYVVSYHCPGGHWSFSASYFESSGADNAPLHAPASGMVSGNGVYAYGPAGTFPTATYKDHNYWVDVVFQAVPPAQ